MQFFHAVQQGFDPVEHFASGIVAAADPAGERIGLIVAAAGGGIVGRFGDIVEMFFGPSEIEDFQQVPVPGDAFPVACDCLCLRFDPGAVFRDLPVEDPDRPPDPVPVDSQPYGGASTLSALSDQRKIRNVWFVLHRTSRFPFPIIHSFFEELK